MSQLRGSNDIGICLMAGEEADAIVEALEERYGDELRVSDHSTYIRVETSGGSLEISFGEIAEFLGRPFNAADFHMVFATYYGRPIATDGGVGVYADMSAGITDPATMRLEDPRP